MRSNCWSRICSPCRDSASGGNVVAPLIWVLMVAAGQATRAMSTTATRIEAHGLFSNTFAQRRHNRPSRAWCSLMTGSLSTRWPSTPSRAGRKVTDAATEKNTTSAPAMPSERSPGEGKKARPTTPTITATPLKKTERPARAVVTPTASLTVAPLCSSSRKRDTMKSA